MLHEEILILDETRSDVFIEIILDENNDLKSGRYILVAKDQPKIRAEYNLEIIK